MERSFKKEVAQLRLGEGEIFLKGGGTIIENIQKKIDKNIKVDKPAQKILDLKILTDEEFKEKYKQTKEKFTSFNYKSKLHLKDIKQ